MCYNARPKSNVKYTQANTQQSAIENMPYRRDDCQNVKDELMHCRVIAPEVFFQLLANYDVYRIFAPSKSSAKLEQSKNRHISLL